MRKVVTPSVIDDPSKKEKALKKVRMMFQDKYKTGEKRWFFTKLRF